jgi:leader peptidase (prepilin peptidase)/N-methyltransferase
MFNLEQSIANWRRRMLAAGIKSPVPLEELEGHLREDVEQQMQSGLNAQQAFEVAVQRIGQAGALKREFAKVGVMRQALQRKAVWSLIGASSLGCCMEFGHTPALAFAYGVLLAGLIVATFIDFEHFIIPDQISLGGIFAGLLFSFLLPSLQGQKLFIPGMLQSLLGIGVGAGLLYLVLRVGKLAFGRQRVALGGETKIIFTDTALLLPGKEISYEELFYRKSDAVTLQARTVEFAGRSYQDVPIRLTAACLQIGADRFKPESVSRMEARSAEIVLPREAMGLGDVKLMAAIGAFLGWQAVIFSLMISSLVGSLVGVGLMVARRQQCSARLPYGPYIALATTIWIFGGKHLFEAMFAR